MWLRNNCKKMFILLFYLLICFFFLRNLILVPGSIGLKDDWSIAYNPHQIYIQGYEHLFTWYLDNLGIASSYPADTYFWLLESLFGFFGINGGIFSKIILIVCLGLSGYFMYGLLKEFQKDRFVAILLSIFYIFTPIIFNSIISGYFSYLLSYTLFPAILMYFIRISNDDFKFNNNLIIFSVLNALSAVHIQFIIINNFIFITYIIYNHFIIKKYLLRNLFTSILFIEFIFIALNSLWIIPLIHNENISKLVTITKTNWIFLTNPSLLGSLMMRGGGYTYYYDTLRFSNNYLLWMANYFALLILALLALLYNKKNQLLCYFSLILIFILFLYKGSNAPFVELGRIIYLNTAFGALFKNVQYLAIITIICILFMISYTSTELKKLLGNKYLFLFSLILFVYLLPWYSGDLNKQVNIFKLDENYSLMNAFIERDSGDYRVLYLPMSNVVEYRNAKFTQFQENRDRSFGLVYGLNPIVYSSEKSTLGNLYTDGDSVDLLDKEFHSYIGKNLSKKLGLMNIKYIIFTTEFESKMQYFMGPEFSTNYDWSNTKIKRILGNQSNILLKQNISNKILIYENTDFYPHIYSANSQTLILNHSVLSESDIDQNYIKNLSILNSVSHPRLSFQKINPTKYKINIESAHEPFYLIFSESFHPGWQVYINTDMIQCNPINTYENLNLTECQHDTKFFEIRDLTRVFDKSIPEDNHFLVNGYANAWYIDPHKLDTGENFTITLYFKPQFYFYIGFMIAVLTFIGCIGYLLWDWRKRGN